VGPLGDIDVVRNKGHIPLANQFFNVKSLLNFAVRKWDDLSLFTHNYIDRLFVLSKLLYIGPVYSLYHAIIRRKASHILLFGGILCFIPIVYVASNARGTGFREGQLMFLWILLYLMFSSFIINVAKYGSGIIVSKLKLQDRNNYSFLIITSIVLVGCLCFQIFVGTINANEKKFKNLVVCKKVSSNNCFSFYWGDFKVGGWANKTVITASKWIKENIAENSKILCQWHYMQSIDFLTENKYQLNLLKTIKSSEIDRYKFPNLGRPLFIGPRYKIKKNEMRGDGFRIMYENLIINKINQHNIKYLIVTYRKNYLTLYLNNNPNFKLLKSFSNGKIKIYKIKSFPVTANSKFKGKFENATYTVLRNLYENNRTKYGKEKSELIKIMNWTAEENQAFFGLIENAKEEIFKNKDFIVRQRDIY
jgi:hypothetical protein